jgi:hypothetical protein
MVKVARVLAAVAISSLTSLAVDDAELDPPHFCWRREALE